jgi:hypothetical protein
MAGKITPLRRRIAPSVPLTLNVTDDGGATFAVNLQLRFDFNVLARIEEKTGLTMLSGADMWSKLSASLLSVMLWSAAIPSSPDYDSDDGLEAIRSYLDKDAADKAANALMEAYLLFLPKEEADLLRDFGKKTEAGKPVPENPPTVEQPSELKSDGSTSGQSQSMTSDLAKSSSAS